MAHDTGHEGGFMDYCNKPSERAEADEIGPWIERAANGDEDAFAFLWRFENFAQVFDDLLDGDKPVTSLEAMRELIAFVETITFNPFYQRHAGQLFGLIVQIASVNITADEWARSENPTQRAMAKTIGPGNVDLILHVAFLTGGWDHMRSLDGIRYYGG